MSKCRPGRRIDSLPALVRVLMLEPSVWWMTAYKPIPSTVVLNWQLRQIMFQIRGRGFRRVIRPNKPAVLP